LSIKTAPHFVRSHLESHERIRKTKRPAAISTRSVWKLERTTQKLSFPKGLATSEIRDFDRGFGDGYNKPIQRICRRMRGRRSMTTRTERFGPRPIYGWLTLNRKRLGMYASSTTSVIDRTATQVGHGAMSEKCRRDRTSLLEYPSCHTFDVGGFGVGIAHRAVKSSSTVSDAACAQDCDFGHISLPCRGSL